MKSETKKRLNHVKTMAYRGKAIAWISYLAAVLCSNAQGAVQVVGTTATQAVLSYTASGTCTVEVSESSSYAPLVHDVDPALFAGANLDTRPEAISSSANHVFVVGKRLIERGSDGKNYSRALQTNTVHYYRVTCGASVVTGSFTTANIPFGMTYTDGLQADPNNPTGYIYPTFAQDRSQGVVDPQTGALVKPLTLLSDVTVTPNVPGWSSAGFHEYCSPVLSSHGYYHCIVPNDYAPMLYGINPTTGDARFLGTLYYMGQTYGLSEGVHGCYGGATAMWDYTDANVIYCGSSAISGDLVAVQLTYTGNDQPVTSGQTAGFPPPAPSTVLNLTPSPNTLTAQLLAFNPSMVGNCGLDAYQAGHLIISCRRGQQDTYAWIGAYDLGNKLPAGSGGTGHVKALIKMWEQPASRWCGNHTYEFLGNIPTVSYATQDLKGSGLPGSGPYQVTLTSSMSATSGVTTVTVSSAWNGSWGTAPSGFQPGEPVSAVVDHFLMQAQVGDYFYADGEYMMLVQKLSSTQWVLQRGMGTIGYYPPQPHSSGTSLTAYCNAGGTVDPGVLPYMWWNFLTSPDASNPADYAANFGGHPVARGNYRVDSGWVFRNGNPTDPSTWGLRNFTGSIDPSPRFAGAVRLAVGNYFEKHPSMPFSAPPWFLDVMPYTGGNGATAGSDADTRPLGGNLYQYFYNGLDNPDYGGDGLSRKRAATLAFNGQSMMTDISGPNAVIDGSNNYAYTYCVANRGGECVSSSHAGDIFFNTPQLTPGHRFCSGNEFYDGTQNICIGDVPTVGFSVSQFKIANDSTGQSMRVVSKLFAFAHNSGTSNTRPLPDGSWTMFWSFPGAPTPTGVYIIKIPPMPASDGVDRTTFVRAPLNLTPPSGLGVVSAKVYFGYSEQGTASQYYCTSRREACVAVSPTVTDANPFSYAQSDTYTPAACAASCTIAIPVLPMHTAYFRVSYLNAGGNEVAAEQGVASEHSISGVGSSITPPPPQLSVSISVTPSNVNLSASQNAQFTATVTGTPNTAVTWSASPSVGSLVNGVYTAPAVISTSQTVTVTATSSADPSKSASASVQLTPTAGVGVSLSPLTATVSAGQTRQFTATVTGSGNAAVTWSINPSVGSVSNGLYTAPAIVNSSQTVIVTATSMADPSKSTAASITLAAAVSNPLALVITSPTSQPTFTATQNTISVGGTASANTTQVTWASDQGGVRALQGQAVGTATWTAAGIALRNGSNRITVTAQDGSGNQSIAVITILFNPPAIAITSLPIAQTGQAYSYALTTVGGTPPFTWSVTPVPAGLTVSGNGVITGTPVTAGLFTLNLSVQDSFQLSTSATVNLQVGSGLSLVSAATLTAGPVAPESWAAAFGSQLADGTASMPTSPVPTQLGGSTVTIRDASGVTRAAGLNYVSPSHVNFTIPSDTAPGTATVTIYTGAEVRATGTVDVETTAPGLFFLNQAGLADAGLLRVQGSSYDYESAVAVDSQTNQYVALPINLGADTDQVYLTLYGTGLRFRASLDAVNIKIGGLPASAVYAGPALYYDDVDIINVLIPQQLRGRGDVDILVTVNGQTANTVHLQIQ